MRYFQIVLTCLVAFRSLALAADAPGEAAVRPSAALGNPLWAVTLEQLPATRDRPLFAPSRRPPPRPEAPRVEITAAIPAPAPPRQPPSVVLMGTVTDADGTWALVRAGGSEKVTHARLGDEISGWKVSEIEARRLVLSSADRSVSFALFAHMGGANDPGRRNPADSVPVARTPDTRAQSFAQERDRRGR
jgi:general secretion pathway protein N